MSLTTSKFNASALTNAKAKEKSILLVLNFGPKSMKLG